MPDPAGDLLERWLAAVVATPGLTAIDDLELARAMLLDDALKAVPLIQELDGPIADVGSGGGTPGIPIAASLPDRQVTLIESARGKSEFLEQWVDELPNLAVIRGRAEEQPTDVFGVVTAKALAKPPTAVEWCLPLARPGGHVVLWVGRSADRDQIARVAAKVAGEPLDAPDGLILLRKTGPTPPGFPRRPAVARKRPLA